MKRITALLVCLTLLLGLWVPASAGIAGEYGVISGSGAVNLRSGPGYEYSILGTSPVGKWFRAEGQQDGWYYGTMVATGVNCWVNASFLSFSNGSTAATGVVNNPVASQFLNLRSLPDLSSRVIAIYYNGVTCSILQTLSGWYYVRVSDGNEGYFKQEYIKVLSGGSTVKYVYAANGGKVNVRNMPTLVDSDILTRCNSGASVQVLLAGDGFSMIAAGSTVGFMSNDYLTDGSHSPVTPIPPVSSSPYCIVKNPKSTQVLNLRAKPDTNSKSLAKYKNGVRLEILDAGKEWCRVKNTSSGKEGYVMTRYVTLYNCSAAPQKTVKNGKNYVNFRRGASEGAAIQGRLYTGNTVTILAPGTEWSYVQYGSQKGYVMTRFLK